MFRLRLFLILFACLFSVQLKAQNLFANPSLEEMNVCTEYSKECAHEAWFYIRPALTPLISISTVPEPFTGANMLIIPVENVFSKSINRPFIYTMLLCPLIKGKDYKLSFYMNTGSNKFYGLDFYMRSKEFTSDNFFPDSVQASIHISSDDIVTTYNGWKLIEKNYTATGNERFCLVGNLSNKRFDYRSTQRMNRQGDIFYFADDLSFVPKEPQPPCNVYQQNKEKLYAQNLRHTERALVEEEVIYVTDTLTIPSLYFETDKAMLKPGFKKLLDSLSLQLKDRNVSNINITGHTDITGSGQHNTVLSTQRADAVKEYLLQKLPALQGLIFLAGMASSVPVAGNETAAGRAKNRRVEIIITSAIRRQ